MTAATTEARGRTMTFPDGFVWGAATAAYQIEGGVDDGGRGASVWDTFAHTPGNVANGHTGDVACDHYHRYREDVRLMKRLGLQAYRFSVAWPRIQPYGSGPDNAKGLDFYDRLVDELLAAGIAPFVTLYHWDLPQALEDLGGWTNRDTAHRFADYATAVHERLGDRVGTWMTFNEPWVQAFLGYGMGIHAPGVSSPAAAFTASHHMLLAHGLAAARLSGRIAITMNLAPVLTPGQLNDPDVTPGPADAEAVNRVDCLLNRQFLDPVLRGAYPDEVLSIVERHAGLGHIHDGDLATINHPLDWLGVNYYTPFVVRSQPGEPANSAYPGTEDIAFSGAHGPTTSMGWAIHPSSLTRLLVRLSRDYPGVGLVVTENGAAFDDVVSGGRVADTDRISFLDGHLRAAHAAIEEGADLHGYLVWSLLDNFEWAEGYNHRFGIVHVDFASQRRTPKDSALWFRQVIRNNGLHQERPRRPTLEVVAARAGVSRSTVSRVINGEASVSEEFREIVLNAVNELGYVPNSAARSLVTSRTDTIAIVTATHAEFTQAAATALERAGRQVRLMGPDAPGWEHMDGVLVVPGPGTDRLLAAVERHDIPAITYGRAPGTAVPYASADDVGGAALAVAHLLERGRRRIATIAGPTGSPAAQDRLAGYRQAVKGRAMVALGDFTIASGAAAMRLLLEDDPDLDAVFAADDLMAIGALHALWEAGRRVPLDVAVAGFGDVAAAPYTIPSLTTVRCPDQAATAVRLLLTAIDGGPSSAAVLPVELVIRAST
ncbi:beta-glucosidase [Streptosporangiaceae bacterium NEAU-GS5]|nr:beta-glucosidase [Streptosporangiaceae bacterium NEAU-GS5]